MKMNNYLFAAILATTYLHAFAQADSTTIGMGGLPPVIEVDPIPSGTMCGFHSSSGTRDSIINIACGGSSIGSGYWRRYCTGHAYGNWCKGGAWVNEYIVTAWNCPPRFSARSVSGGVSCVKD